MREEDLRLWAVVTATIRPLPGRRAPAVAQADPRPRPLPSDKRVPANPRVVRPNRPQPIEPNRRRLLRLGRESLGARLDLHGLDQDAARRALTEVIEGAYARDIRGVLVITGKGSLGEGVLRRRVPEWLGEPPLRPLIAGLGEAHARHGGAGALYVALKRRPRA